MYMPKLLIVLSFSLMLTANIALLNATEAEHKNTDEPRKSPNLGEVATEDLIKAWDISIFPDGRGLPQGQGNVADGKALYQIQCAICHGPAGVGASAEELAGGEQGLTGEYPDKTIGTYWPYATTLFDFIQRAMPLATPGSLSADQTYAVTAYLLYVNQIIDEDFQLDQENLAKIEMPNRQGFESDYSPAKDE